MDTNEDTVAMFAHYDKMMKSVQQMHRGKLIDRLGNVLWEEGYDDWQLRIRRQAEAYTCDSLDGCHCGGDTPRVRRGCYYFKDAAIHA